MNEWIKRHTLRHYGCLMHVCFGSGRGRGRRRRRRPAVSWSPVVGSWPSWFDGGLMSVCTFRGEAVLFMKWCCQGQLPVPVTFFVIDHFGARGTSWLYEELQSNSAKQREKKTLLVAYLFISVMIKLCFMSWKSHHYDSKQPHFNPYTTFLAFKLVFLPASFLDVAVCL